MLDLEALVSEMQGLAGEVVRSAGEARARVVRAAEQLQNAGDMPGLREAILDFGQDMAIPAPGRDMRRTVPAEPAEDYTIIATDGSQVPPDYHHVAPWYVINAGAAVLRYGGPPDRPRAVLSSQPALKPPRRGASLPAEDTLAEGASADGFGAAQALPVSVEVDRLLAEVAAATRLLDEEADAGRTVLLLDGPLVQWRMITILQPPSAQAEVLAAFRALLEKAYETRTPIAGYISRSRAVEWVTLLRVSLCPAVAERGQLCDACRKSLLRGYQEPPKDAHHGPLLGVRDVDLAAQILSGRGARTEIIALQSRVWTRLTDGCRCPLGAAGFFYLHTGTEVARVELPQWVWDDPDLLERLHAAIYDQCDAGHGYPMVLSEAHEAAVVRGPDRDSFYALIERVLNDSGVYDPVTSAKALSKRRPLA